MHVMKQLGFAAFVCASLGGFACSSSETTTPPTTMRVPGRANSFTNPSWTLHAAGELGYAAQWWPAPYERGRRQLERELQRRVDMFEAGAS